MNSSKECWIKSYDGTQIGYKIWGEGEQVIALCNGLSTTESYWKYFIRHFSNHYRIITWDYRGHGESQPPVNPEEITISSHARDLKQILSRENIMSAVVGGFSMGVPVCLEFCHLFPENCKGIILIAGTAEKPLESMYFWGSTTPKIVSFLIPLGSFLNLFIPVLLKMFIKSPLIYPFCLSTRMISSKAKLEDLKPHFESITRMDINLFLRMAKAMNDYKAEKALQSIKVPTLIVGGTADMFTRHWAQKKMSRKISNSIFLTIPGGTHVVPLEEPLLINQCIDQFLKTKIFTSRKNPSHQS